MCKKKKVIVEAEPVLDPAIEAQKAQEQLEKERLDAITHPEQHDYFTEYYNAYKNQYIDQYLRAYKKFKETGEVTENLDDIVNPDLIPTQEEKPAEEPENK